MEIFPEIEKAIAEVATCFPDGQVICEPDGQGGAYVIVQDVFLGDHYMPDQSWVGFQIGYQYPSSDVYPHFVRADFSRIDGRSLGEGFSGPVEWRGRRAVQISRRSNRWNPAVDTAAVKLMKVLEWVKTR